MNELQIIEHNDMRVVTTKQIAEMYGTDSKTISYNFNHNKGRYTDGKHYILLSGEDLRAFREIHDLPYSTPKLYLWTERGALLLAKSINTDVAWDAYERLVDFYFQKKQESLNLFNNNSIDTNDKYIKAYLEPKSWFEQNNDKMKKLCDTFGWNRKYLYHKILLELSDFYNMPLYERMYIEKYGHKPVYAMDLVEYSLDMQRTASRYLDYLLSEIEQEN